LDKDTPSKSPQFRDLSNQFFTLIPHKFNRRGDTVLIDNQKYLDEKVEMLDSLEKILVAQNFLKLNKDEEGESYLICESL
jgi:hypothetical protein